VLQVGRLKDAGKVEHHTSRWQAEQRLDGPSVHACRATFWRNGVADDYPSCASDELESVKTYEGTHDIHTLIIGQSVTGIEHSDDGRA